MSEQIQGKLEILNNASEVTITLRGGNGVVTVGDSGKRGIIDINDSSGTRVFRLNGNDANLRAGGLSNAGVVEICDGGDKSRVVIDGGAGDVRVKDAAGNTLFHFDSSQAALYLGGQGNEGDLVVRDGANKERIKLDSGKGDVWVKNAAGKTLFHFDSTYAALYLGGQGNEGDLVVRDGANKERIKLDGGQGDVWVKNAAGKTLFHFDSKYAALYLGGQGNEGDLIVRDEANKERIKLDGGQGDIRIKDAAGTSLFHFDSAFAALYLGGQGNEGDLIVRNGAGDQTIKLDGGGGDIILSNADAAEDFEVANAAEASAGTVMVLAHDGRLEPCAGAYDRRVVGVVSGAGQYRPGIVFDRGESAAEGRVPISIMGKVSCRVDARYGSIRVGDLLTSSPTAGCAMKSSDPLQASGSILGKALSPLDDGEDLVEMLVSLQ